MGSEQGATLKCGAHCSRAMLSCDVCSRIICLAATALTPPPPPPPPHPAATLQLSTRSSARSSAVLLLGATSADLDICLCTKLYINYLDGMHSSENQSIHIAPRASAAVADIVAAGGKRIGTKGYFIEPTVFADVKDDMKIAKVCSVSPLYFVVQLPPSQLSSLI